MFAALHALEPARFEGTFDGFRALVHPDDQGGLLDAIGRALQGEPYRAHYRVIRPDGSVRWLDSRGALERQAPDDPLTLVGMALDVTEGRQGLDESEKYFRAAFDGALDAMLLVTESGRLIDANDASSELLGQQVGSLVGRPVSELLPRLETSSPFDPFGSVGAEPRGAAVLLSPDGSRLEIEYSTTSNVVPGRHLSVLRDITTQKRLNESLSFLVEASAILSDSLDPTGAVKRAVELAVPRIADWAVLDMFDESGGLHRVALTHSNPVQVRHAEELLRNWAADAAASRSIAAVIRRGRSSFNPEVTASVLQKLGSAELVEAARSLAIRSAVCVPIALRGRSLGALTFLQAESGRRFGPADVAYAEDFARRVATACENSQLYAAERAARRQADSANRAKDEFLATASHELRTPLSAVLGWTRILREGVVAPAKQRHALDIIERNALNLARLIEDLVDVSRIGSGILRISPVSLDLGPLVEQVVESLRPVSDAKQLQVDVERESSPFVLQADPDRLRQVIWNLLSNAIKFTPAGGLVHVTLSAEPAWYAITVSDTGSGIRADLLPHVFERFRQGEDTSTRGVAGLGLGLSIARHIVELHGGQIHALSGGEGHGSTFSVQLPLDSDPSDAPAPTSAPSGALRYPELDGLALLAVDDDADALELISAVLAEYGVKVTTAQNAADALSRARSDAPSIVIADIGLPGRDGYFFIRELQALDKATGRQTVALALTAYTRTEDRRRVLAAGYAAHLSKPMDPKAMARAVAELARAGQRS